MTGFGLASILAFAAVAAPPQVTVTTLAGEQHAGELASLARESLQLTKDGVAKKLTVSDLMEVRFAPPAQPVDTVPQGPVVLATLSDGSTVQATAVRVAKREMTLESPVWGTIKLPITAVAGLRFSGPDQQVNASWTELSARQRKEDMLVVQKGAVLDHLKGTVGEISDDAVTFVLPADGDGKSESVQVKKPKIFGILYSTRKPPTQQPACEVLAAGGDRLKLRFATWNGEEWQAALVVGGEVKLAPERLLALDFSLGKVKYLSDMEWRDMKLTPYWDTETDRILFSPQKDRNGDGGRLRLGVPLRPGSRFLVSKVYQRGLWLHSKTTLKYRLNGDYRRMTAMMGISYDMLRYNRGDVHVKITGDGKPLFEGDVNWTEPGRPLDLDLTDIRELEILVDFGKDQLPDGDEFVLADAKLVK